MEWGENHFFAFTVIVTPWKIMELCVLNQMRKVGGNINEYDVRTTAASPTRAPQVGFVHPSGGGRRGRGGCSSPQWRKLVQISPWDTAAHGPVP